MSKRAESDSGSLVVIFGWKKRGFDFDFDFGFWGFAEGGCGAMRMAQWV